MFANELGTLNEDFFGPPQQGQTDAEFQAKMQTVAVVAGVGALALVNPVIAVGAGLTWLLTRPKEERAANRFSQDELKGGH